MTDNFEASDFHRLHVTLVGAAAIDDEATLRAAMSNNFNVILAALARSAITESVSWGEHDPYGWVLHNGSSQQPLFTHDRDQRDDYIKRYYYVTPVWTTSEASSRLLSSVEN